MWLANCTSTCTLTLLFHDSLSLKDSMCTLSMTMVRSCDGSWLARVFKFLVLTDDGSFRSNRCDSWLDG